MLDETYYFVKKLSYFRTFFGGFLSPYTTCQKAEKRI